MRDEAQFTSIPLGALPPGPAPERGAVALDADLLRWFEEMALRDGRDPESLINMVLRDYMCRAGEPLERTLRRVLREELRKAG